jgi:hypothetical protein
MGVALAGACTFFAGPAGAQIGPINTFGTAMAYGAPAGAQLSAPLLGIAVTSDGKGYWLLGADGGVFNYGDAGFYGSEGSSGVVTPFVGIAPTSDGHGYWITGDFGNVYNFGDAATEASLTGRLAAPVVGITANHKGMGYWLAGADGGVFSFGDARYYGSLGAVHLNQPVVAIASTRDDGGYWLVAADGGVFSFGDAHFYGSLGATPPSSRMPVVAMASAPQGSGYWLATADRELPPPTPVPSVLAQCTQPGAAPSVQPATIILACGDGNAWLGHLTWTSWTPTTATATGFFTHNTCTPNCAEGTFVSTPATVGLDYPIQTSAGLEFATISYSYANPSGGSSTFIGVVPTSPG